MPAPSGQAAYRHRLATLEDLPTIVAIYNSTVASRCVTADVEPVTLASRLDWFHQHQPQRRPLWVIEMENDEAHRAQNKPHADSFRPAILGWLSYSDFNGRAAYAGTVELSVYIDQAWRGRGVGSYCMRQAIESAPALAVHTLLALIFGHNAASLALFERFGFGHWGRLPQVASLDGIGRDLLILGKRVGPA